MQAIRAGDLFCLLALESFGKKLLDCGTTWLRRGKPISLGNTLSELGIRQRIFADCFHCSFTALRRKPLPEHGSRAQKFCVKGERNYVSSSLTVALGMPPLGLGFRSFVRGAM
jgi:hypothetical protein